MRRRETTLPSQRTGALRLCCHFRGAAGQGSPRCLRPAMATARHVAPLRLGRRAGVARHSAGIRRRDGAARPAELAPATPARLWTPLAGEICAVVPAAAMRPIVPSPRPHLQHVPARKAWPNRVKPFDRAVRLWLLFSPARPARAPWIMVKRREHLQRLAGGRAQDGGSAVRGAKRMPASPWLWAVAPRSRPHDPRAWILPCPRAGRSQLEPENRERLRRLSAGLPAWTRLRGGCRSGRRRRRPAPQGQS